MNATDVKELVAAQAEHATEICAVDGSRIEWGSSAFRYGAVWCCAACAAKSASVEVLVKADRRERMLRELYRPGSKSGITASAYLSGNERALGGGPEDV